MNKTKVISVSGVSKSFYTDGYQNKKKVLDNISFNVFEGDYIGIIGPNGCGKSTLLTLLSGITLPDSGKIEIYGKVAGILDIGAGFHPEYSGLENIFLNGQLLGFSKKEIKNKLDEIIEFSGVGHYINEPVKNYSSGMYLRLAFSIIAILNFDVYLFDEVMSVGDAAFRIKCREKIREIIAERNKTILTVSHNIWELSDVNKIFYLNNGELDTTSSKDEILKKYFSKSEEYKMRVDNPFFINKAEVSDFVSYVEKFSCSIQNVYPSNLNTFMLKSDDEIKFEIQLKGIKQYFNVGICLRDKFENSIMEISHVLNNIFLNTDNTNKRVTLSIPPRFFNAGEFIVDLVFFNEKQVLFYRKEALRFNVEIEDALKNTIYEKTWGVVKPFFNWEIEELSND